MWQTKLGKWLTFAILMLAFRNLHATYHAATPSLLTIRTTDSVTITCCLSTVHEVLVHQVALKQIYHRRSPSLTSSTQTDGVLDARRRYHAIVESRMHTRRLLLNCTRSRV